MRINNVVTLTGMEVRKAIQLFLSGENIYVELSKMVFEPDLNENMWADKVKCTTHPLVLESECWINKTNANEWFCSYAQTAAAAGKTYSVVCERVYDASGEFVCSWSSVLHDIDHDAGEI